MIKDSDFRLIFDRLPGLFLILKPDPPRFTVIYMNEEYAEATMSDWQIIGKGLFEVLPEHPRHQRLDGVEKTTASLLKVIETKKPHRMNIQRFDAQRPGTDQFDARYWAPVNTPVLDEDQNLIYIIHSVEDVTKTVLLKEVENKAQQELERMHEEQSQILESIEDGFISTDRNWTVKYWNRKAEEIFNIARGHILGRNLWDVIKENKAKKLYECFHEAMQKNKPVHFEKHFAVQNIWLQINAYPSDQGLTAFLVNITENKNVQEVIRNNERRNRAMIENISDGLAVISKKGVILDVSYSGKKILGYGYKDLLGKNKWRKLIHADDLLKVKKAFNKTLRIFPGQQLFISKLGSSAFQNMFRDPANEETVEYRFKMADGSYKWLEGTFHNLIHEETIRAIVLTFRDITKRRQQEEQLQTSEEKYRSLFHNSPATIIIWTLDDLCVREVNQTALKLLGYTRDELMRTNLLDLQPVQEHERLMNLALELKNGTIANTGVWVYKSKQGKLMFMDISFHKINYGDHHAVLSLGTNVTDKIILQKKLEKERRKRQEEITEAVLTTQENERSELGKELHDNINQILTTARLYIEHALTKKDRQEELLQYSREYISKAIHEIRQLSRTLMPPSLGDISLKQGLEELFLSLKALKDSKFEFEFLIDREENINDSIRLAIFRIVQEQLNNILKHAEATEVILQIVQIDHTVRVYIKDNGIGFDTKNGPRGLGLRNIISRANLFGGQVDINSEVGKGTELQVSFQLSHSQ